jgi:hypothetical protein
MRYNMFADIVHPQAKATGIRHSIHKTLRLNFNWTSIKLDVGKCC